MDGEEHVGRDEIVNLLRRVVRECCKGRCQIACSTDNVAEDCQVEIFDASDEILDGGRPDLNRSRCVGNESAELSRGKWGNQFALYRRQLGGVSAV